MKTANLFVSILAAVIMFIGDIFPLLFETGVGLILYILDGLTGGIGANESTAWALAILVPALLILIISGTVVVLAIIAAIMAEKRHVKTYIVLNAMTAVITLVAIVSEICIALWRYELKAESMTAYYWWVALTCICMFAGIVLTALTVKRILHK